MLTIPHKKRVFHIYKWAMLEHGCPVTRIFTPAFQDIHFPNGIYNQMAAWRVQDQPKGREWLWGRFYSGYRRGHGRAPSDISTPRIPLSRLFSRCASFYTPLFFFFLAEPRSMQDFSSPTRWLNPCPLQWKLGVFFFFFNFFFGGLSTLQHVSVVCCFLF